MQLNTLHKTTERRKRRLGRGHGSGRGKTAGRGTKGQNAKGKAALSFEGGALPLIKRLPFLRGRSKNKVFKKKPIAINVKFLNILPTNSVVDLDTIIKHKILDEDIAKSNGVKILGEGELSVSLEVKLPVSKGARVKIEKAGGKVI
ncbi:MAG: 50S ribosomal protein L15 [Candidatus Levybacteria bacterium RIFCSPHIGHO2_01_FULL_36_15]|nr:MAG: 50S ribosomal protein L15 [Candidatus Levybacteria bacterium RIFCSPHIGHO2_01_FULL_36_15]OGH38371.1 MAG: 50S ribosomal protein L15 [Candidatus Levybacteria bacterium RIFCSPLOWO2_01_FULL_36_10]